MPVETLTKSEPTAPRSGPPTRANASRTPPPPHHRFPGALANPHVRVGLLTVAVLLVEVALARTVLDVEITFFALLAPFFVFTAYKVSGQRGRTAEIVAAVAVVGAAAVVLLAYALS